MNEKSFARTLSSQRMKSLLAILALIYLAQSIDITKPNGDPLDWNTATTPQTGNFSINNGINCGGVICPNCNGSNYDVTFRDPATLLEVIEVGFGWTSDSSGGPNCSARAFLLVQKTVPTGNPPAGYQFASPVESWTATALLELTLLILKRALMPTPTQERMDPSPLVWAATNMSGSGAETSLPTTLPMLKLRSDGEPRLEEFGPSITMPTLELTPTSLLISRF
jgi:hypothetical protein